MNPPDTKTPAASPVAAGGTYSWSHLLAIALEQKRTLVFANIVAIPAVAASVPAPLLMPLLVDEVLLKRPGILVTSVNAMLPPARHGPVLYISMILLATTLLRATALLFGVRQTRQFTLVSKVRTKR